MRFIHSNRIVLLNTQKRGPHLNKRGNDPTSLSSLAYQYSRPHPYSIDKQVPAL